MYYIFKLFTVLSGQKRVLSVVNTITSLEVFSFNSYDCLYHNSNLLLHTYIHTILTEQLPPVGGEISFKSDQLCTLYVMSCYLSILVTLRGACLQSFIRLT